MAPSIFLYTVLFTLEDKPIAKNKFIEMFIMWFCLLIKSESLDENDVFFLIIDMHTKDFLFNYTIFLQLLNKVKFQIKLMNELQQPKTLLEGCMWKYNILKDYLININQDIFFYTDIDCLIIKSIKNLTKQIPPDSITIHEESNFYHDFYNQDIPSVEIEEFKKILPNIKGLSAGKFLIYGKHLFQDLCNRIIQYNNISQTNYITLEQPFFNRSIYNIVSEKKFQLFNLNDFIIHSKDIKIIEDKVLLIDACGVPGDYDLHFNRILPIFCLYFNS